MRLIYLLLAVIGFVLPYFFFLSFLMEKGLDLPLLFNQLFANDIATFFAVDLIITAVVLLIFFYTESQRLGMQCWWLYALATLVIGPSFSFPIYLYFRQDRVAGPLPEKLP